MVGEEEKGKEEEEGERRTRKGGGERERGRHDKCLPERRCQQVTTTTHIHIVRRSTGDFIGCCRGQPEVKVQTSRNIYTSLIIPSTSGI